MSGEIPAMSQQEIEITVKTGSVPMGQYWAGIQFESNDPAKPIAQIPIRLLVGITGIDNESQNVPKTVQLSQNYPNPFNPTTVINYALPSRQKVEISVYNMLGQKVRSLLNDEMNAGMHQVEWDGKNSLGNQVATGIYIYQLVADGVRINKKMMLLK